MKSSQLIFWVLRLVNSLNILPLNFVSFSPKLQDKIWNRKPGFEASWFIILANLEPRPSVPDFVLQLLLSLELAYMIKSEDN